ncbi:hypothetical protein G6F40_017592 [Rhizopus arrhizus]|nr:hypothetical protein G6F40_017592 [Rhizopus arrhizus]
MGRAGRWAAGRLDGARCGAAPYLRRSRASGPGRARGPALRSALVGRAGQPGQGRLPRLPGPDALARRGLYGVGAVAQAPRVPRLVPAV